MSKTQKVKAVAVLPPAVLAKLERESLPIIKKAKAITVKSANAETSAYEIRNQIRARRKLVEEKRLSITGPLNQSLKSANALFKTLSQPLKAAEEIIEDKIFDFREEQEKKAQAKQEKLQARAEEAEEAGDEERAERLEERAADITPKVGETKTTRHWTYKVVDLSKVPHPYLTLDRGAVQQAVRAGIREIPGLEIYQEESVR